jgi:hypothetical protein
MKPWFERDAKIIKFPEPEKKVIQMPNVASYPDFITGVSDLKARMSKGEISQSSHDKLYTDLIHRFMRKEDVESPWFQREETLNEATQGNRGEANEIFVAVGLFLAFRDRELDAQKLYNFILNDIKAQGDNVSIKAQGPNGDMFKLELPIPKSLSNFLFNTDNYSTITKNKKAQFAGMLRKVVQVVKAEFKEQVTFIHDNERKDAVNISVLGGAGGKIDVLGTVTYKKDGQEITEPLKNMELSLKVDSKHFDQLSGKEMVRSFSAVTGVNAESVADASGLTEALKTISPLAAKITPTQSKKIDDKTRIGIWNQIIKVLYAENEPMNKFYSGMADLLTQKLSSSGDEKFERAIIANALGSMIEKGITKDEGKLSLLKFDRKGYKILDSTAIRKISVDMAQADLTVVYAVPGDGRPRLLFKDTTGKMYFQIRNFINKYGILRNYIETGDKFDEYTRFVSYKS